MYQRLHNNTAATRIRRGSGCLFVLLAIAGLVLATGCGEDEPTDEERAEAAVSWMDIEVPSKVVAGALVPFPCPDAPVILPTGGWSGTGAMLATRVGHYRWRCLDGSRTGRIEVKPGPPVSVRWGELPDAVRLGESRRIQPHTADPFGNPTGPELSFDASPAHRVERAGQRLRFVGAGPVTLTAHYQGHPRDTRELVVDSGPPVVRITSPARGTVVRRTLAPGITVSGVVREDGPVVALTIGERSVSVSPDGHFETTVYPRGTGLHVIDYRAVDATGQETRGSRAVLYGPLRDPRKGLQRAARVHLPRWLLDDDEDDLDDLAAAIKVLMGVIRIPDQRINFGCNGQIDLEDISLRADDVDLDPVNGGVELVVSLRDVSVDLDGEACGCAFGRSVGCVTASGRVRTDSVKVRMKAEIGETGPTSLRVHNARLTLSELDIHWDFLWGGLDWLIEIFEPEIRETVEDEVEAAVTERARANLADVLSAVVPIQTIDMPAPLRDVVAIRTELTDVEVSPRGVRADVKTIALPGLGGASPRAMPGISRRTVRASGLPPNLPQDKIGVAVSLDVMNDAIYSLYASGGLDDVDIFFEEVGMVSPSGIMGPVNVTASLPPMLLPGEGPGEVSLVVGDLRVQVETVVDTAALFVSFQVPGRLSFNEEAHAIELELVADGLEIHFEPASVEDAVTLSATFHDLEGAVRQVVSGSVVGKTIKIPVPVLDLSKIKGIPRAPQLRFYDAVIEVTDGGYVVATGKVRP